MTSVPDTSAVWRVGHVSDPLGFVPWERTSWSHRFDDLERRFRTLYCAVMPETYLREVLADLRPNAAQIADYVSRFGELAEADVPARLVTTAWRSTNVLVPARLTLDGRIVDLTDPLERDELERHHAPLLAEAGMAHLDLHEITVQLRPVTQAIASDARDRLGAAAIRFPSRLDGNPCLAVFEGRGRLDAGGDPVALTDPAPEALVRVAAGWRLALQPAPARTPSARSERPGRAL